MQEIEYKFRVESHEEMACILEKLGATSGPTIEQTDSFYDWPEGLIRDNDRCLRIRKLTPVDGAGGSTFELTYKGPRQDAAAKIRDEFETGVTDPEKMEMILLALGMVKTMTIQKRRISYCLESCKVELDELPYIGCFVEIEGPSIEAIDQVKRQIAPDAEHIDKSYAKLLRGYCRKNDISTQSVVF